MVSTGLKNVKKEISTSTSIIHSFLVNFWPMSQAQTNDITITLGQIFKWHKMDVSSIFDHFYLLFYLAVMSQVCLKIRQDHKIHFQNSFYTNCIHILIDNTVFFKYLEEYTSQLFVLQEYGLIFVTLKTEINV